MPKEGQRFRVDDDVERRIWKRDSSVTQFLFGEMECRTRTSEYVDLPFEYKNIIPEKLSLYRLTDGLRTRINQDRTTNEKHCKQLPRK